MGREREAFYSAAADEEERLLLSRVRELAEKGSRTLTSTRFLTPAEQALARRALESAGYTFLADTGFGEGERAILLFPPDYYDGLSLEELRKLDEHPLATVSVCYRGPEAPAHRDYLGALLAAGIERSAAGDIILCERGCFIPLLKSVVPFVKATLERAGSARLDLYDGAEKAGAPLERAFEAVKATVASPRADALLSEAFSISRSDAADACRSGLFSLNHQLCLKPEKLLVPGDMLSLRGHGRAVFYSEGGQSRKGRTFVELHRLV